MSHYSSSIGGRKVKQGDTCSMAGQQTLEDHLDSIADDA